MEKIIIGTKGMAELQPSGTYNIYDCFHKLVALQVPSYSVKNYIY